MKFKKTTSSEILEGDLTPMIDMTFQLIAFFMLLINFSEIDRAEQITLPSSVLAIPPTTPPDYQIILNLEPDATVVFEGERIELDFIDRRLAQQVKAATREGVFDPAKIAVVIRAHQDTPTGKVQKLIGICQAEKLESFNLRVINRVN
jgi:biopolymer transport protein ExbD